jgi:polyisoprenoid-binding protein YceI
VHVSLAGKLLPDEIAKHGVRFGFEGVAEINRKDFGLTWNAALETGGILVSENIKLEFEISTIAAK